MGISKVGLSKTVQGCERSTGCDLEHGAEACAAGIGGPIEIAIQPKRQPVVGIRSVGTVKINQCRQRPDRGHLKHGAVIVASAGFGGAIEIIIRPQRQTRVRIGSVGAGKVGQRGQCAIGQQSEDHTIIADAAVGGGAVEVAIEPEGKTAIRIGSIRAVEISQHRQSAVGRQLKHSAEGLGLKGAGSRLQQVGATASGGAIEIPVWSLYQGRLRIGTIGKIAEVVQQGELPGGRYLVRGAVAGGATRFNDAVEAPARPRRHTGIGIVSRVPGETGQRGESSVGAYLEHRARPIGAAPDGGAVKIAVRSQGQIRLRIRAVPVVGIDQRGKTIQRGQGSVDDPGAGCRIVGGVIHHTRVGNELDLDARHVCQHGQRAVGGDLKYCPAAICAALGGGAVEIAVRPQRQPGVWELAVRGV